MERISQSLLASVMQVALQRDLEVHPSPPSLSATHPSPPLSYPPPHTPPALSPTDPPGLLCIRVYAHSGFKTV